MKKTIFAAAALALSAQALAIELPSSNSPYYAQADVGYSHINAKHTGETVKEGDVAFRVALGRTYGNTRYAVDYTRFGGAEKRVYSAKTVAAGEMPFVPAGTYTLENSNDVEVHSVGVSAYYDFAKMNQFTPYVGARLGVNRLSHDIGEDLHIGGEDYDISGHSINKTQVGAGVSAGVQYEINPALTLDVGAEYNHFGKVEDIKVHQYGAKVGLRYNF
ncbi:opacity family porin [Moraxella sp.]|uniref:opacity family porin n=1 Tax=Moraxella sp. TaxID=479 RepID=UPI0026DC3AE0|nr:opacity family porin [Moraxella sp.]MDO4894724.1 opacity family porin [Moraxella sp.]